MFSCLFFFSSLPRRSKNPSDITPKSDKGQNRRMHNAASTTKLGHQQMGVRNREQVKRGGGEWKKKGVTKVVAGGGVRGLEG